MATVLSTSVDADRLGLRRRLGLDNVPLRRLSQERPEPNSCKGLSEKRLYARRTP